MSDSTSEKEKRPKKRFGVGRLFLWLFGFVCLLGLLALGAGATLLYWASRDLPNITRIADYNPPQATVILARDGEVMGTLYHEKRFLVSLNQMSPYIPQAFLAAEDDGFYSHKGVDPTAILRAFINNLRRGRPGEGGSTITQQLIKQLLLTSERSYTRKMKEAILAYQLEKDLSKAEILTIYLNQIYLGDHAYGVEAAARNYFGKHASDITLAEAAVLAGLPKAPTRYNPFKAPKAAKERQLYVLGRMRDLEWISEAEYARAVDEPLVYWSMPEGMTGPAEWYTEEARRLLIEFFTEANLKALGVETDKYGEDYVYEAGLVVRTAMVPYQQEAAGAALRRGLRELDKRQGWRGPLSEKNDLAAFERSQRFSPTDLGGGGWVQAYVTSVKDGQATVALGDGYSGIIPESNMTWAKKANSSPAAAASPVRRGGGEVVRSGDIIWVSLPFPKTNEKGEEITPFNPDSVTREKPVVLRLQQVPLVQGALASLEPQTGDVVALIGGYSFGDSHFNRATQARRQPGSSFKPIVYSASLDAGFTPFSTVLDAPVVYVNPATNQVWRPSNYENSYKGSMPLWRALALSRNTCTVRVAQSIGVNAVIDRAKVLGLEPNFPRELSISLGAVAVSPLNMTQAYAAFANQGLGVRPRIITSIHDSRGRELYDQPPEHWQALTPQNAYMMAMLLQNVVNAGTGTRAKIEGRHIAGKTGTTNDEHDAWFVGFTPYLVTGVYVGYDQIQSLGAREQGGRTAAPIFRYYRTMVEDLYAADDFTRPDGITMSGNIAYRADEPMYGKSAADGYERRESQPVSAGASGDSEDLMRQMF